MIVHGPIATDREALGVFALESANVARTDNIVTEDRPVGQSLRTAAVSVLNYHPSCKLISKCSKRKPLPCTL